MGEAFERLPDRLAALMSRKSKAARKRPNRPSPAVRRPAASAAPEVADVEAPLDQTALNSLPTAPAAAGPAAAAAAPSAGTGPRGARKGVGRIEPGAAAARRRERASRPGSLSAGFEPLDPGDPSIPYDRVPYVPADLRRVAMIAGAMILLILLADLIVSNAVK
ncbi:MAG: hypothetical protein NVSMB29_06140 [Candidatus Dormibacteria bacterium]